MTPAMIIFFSLLLILLVEVQVVAVFSAIAYFQSKPKPEELWTPTQADKDALEAEARLRELRGLQEDLAPLGYEQYRERFEELTRQ